MVQKSAAARNAKVEQRKQEILAAASAVFRRKGLHAAGMREIASELDMHAGNIYYYFDNKQELLAYCQDQALASLLRLGRDILRSADTPEEKLRRLVIGHVECLNDQTPGSLAHLEVEALDRPWRKKLQRHRDRYEEMIRSVLQEGIDSGRFRCADTGITGKALLGSLNWTVKWFSPRGPLTAQQIGEELADLFLCGLVSPSTPPSQAPAGESNS